MSFDTLIQHGYDGSDFSIIGQPVQKPTGGGILPNCQDLLTNTTAIAFCLLRIEQFRS
jgi:hypothetical protein